MTNTIDPISYNAGIEAADGYNGCYRIAIQALQYLANHPRPPGGSDMFNSEHLLQIADEMKRSRRSLHRTEPQTAPDEAAKRFRAWPHDEPDGWNLNAARFVELLQSQPMMWLRLTRAKYIEMRIDTRDGGFNLYDRDREPLEPDEVVAAIKEATEKYGAGPYRPSDAAPADAEWLALADDIQKRIDLYIDAIGTANAPLCKAALEQFLWDSKRDIVSSLRAGGWREDMENAPKEIIALDAEGNRRIAELMPAQSSRTPAYWATKPGRWRIEPIAYMPLPSALKKTDKEG